jgi:hypothetical protein
MLRSALASRAVEQEGKWSMSKTEWDPRRAACLGAERRRYVVVNQEIDAM